MNYKRTLNLHNLSQSAFLFGPRMTGKTHLLSELHPALLIDLLDPEIELALARSPKLFWEKISVLHAGDLVVIDEIQHVPSLLNYVQKGIEELRLRFILSGSSARKLKRGGVNLLGGRALALHLHPLTFQELGVTMTIDQALSYGSLPWVAASLQEGREDDVRRYLAAYNTVYIKEEVQAEALTRNIGAFNRFLNVAAQMNAQVLEYAHVARDAAVPASTVKEYFSIMEDTLLGSFLWPWDKSERKKARPKFYFFDCGVLRAIQNRIIDPPTPMEKGFLFETMVHNELKRARDYYEKPYELAYWREGNYEVDILVMGPRGPVMAFECKCSGAGFSGATVAAFQKRFKGVPLYGVSLQDTQPRKMGNGMSVLPLKDAVDIFLGSR